MNLEQALDELTRWQKRAAELEALLALPENEGRKRVLRLWTAIGAARQALAYLTVSEPLSMAGKIVVNRALADLPEKP